MGAETALKTLHAVHHKDFKSYDTAATRENFLIDKLEQNDAVNLVYTHYERMIAGLAKPVSTTLNLDTYENLKSEFFLERRELGIINIGGDGDVVVDGTKYNLSNLDCLYAGKGVKNISFSSANAATPALFYLLSTPAHVSYPTTFMKASEANPLQLGDKATCNERSLYKYIHNDGIQSCQLVMGVTVIKDGSVWNSIPPHVHDRRSEIYFYFGLAEGNKLFHFMGEPNETRHIVIGNNEAVASPSWSMHFGVGTGSYGFIWAMGGENKEFTDMDAKPIATLL